MAQKGKGKGFSSMDENKKKEVASQGGRASAQSNTANRGFASMDKDKQRKISSQGGRASQSNSSKQKGPSVGSREHIQTEEISQQADASEKDLRALQEEELAGSASRSSQS